MDEEPLVATEEASIIDDYSHSIETLLNLPILIHSILISEHNMDTSNESSTSTQVISEITKTPLNVPNETSLAIEGRRERSPDKQTDDRTTTQPIVEDADMKTESRREMAITSKPDDVTSELSTTELSTTAQQEVNEHLITETIKQVESLAEQADNLGKASIQAEQTNVTVEQTIEQREQGMNSKTIEPSVAYITTPPGSTSQDVSTVRIERTIISAVQPGVTESTSVAAREKVVSSLTQSKEAMVIEAGDQNTESIPMVTVTEDATRSNTEYTCKLSTEETLSSVTVESPSDVLTPTTTIMVEVHSSSASKDPLPTSTNQTPPLKSPPCATLPATQSAPTTVESPVQIVYPSIATTTTLSTIHATASPMSVISSPRISPPTHVPVVKATHQTPPPLQMPKESDVLVGMSAEKLKAVRAEVLQSSAELFNQQKIEIKSREDVVGKAPPQVAVIPPIIDLFKSQDQSRYLVKQQGQGMLKKGREGGVISMDKMGPVSQMSSVHRGTSDGKSPHQVARRIWMSSCRPLDPASLERIGVDSKGNMYWYDGGKNMFLSPLSNDTAYKPSESELQLVCKSMVQWTAKLKELRMSSDQQADIQLAQTIKDQYMSRVRVATQRKPRDVSVLQNLQAVHAASVALKQAQHNKSHIVTMATSDSSKAPQFVQSAFPQGSILVVPHGGSPFHTVLPMFGSNPMMIQQPVAGVTAIAGKDSPLPTTSVATQAISAVASSTVIPSNSSVMAAATNDSNIAVQQSETDTNQDTKQTAMVLTSEQAKSLFTSEQAKALFNTNQSTVNMPVIVPPSLAGSVLSSMIPNYQQAFAYFAPVCAMKVADPVKMEDISFECKSIEISGEVPIKRVLIDEHKEGSSEDIEVTDSVTEQPKRIADSKPEPAVVQPAMFEGHSSAEVMSARLLLSLTGRSENMIPQDSRALFEKAVLSKPLTREEAIAISTPVSSSPSSGRKRKQTPIASARPSVSDDTSLPTKGKRGKKPKADGDKVTQKRKTPQKKNAKADASTPNKISLTEPPIPKVADDESLESSQALASMQQLKASRSSKPMKEYVIETDSDSDSSSSGSSSSRANSDSSSDSSSESSSEEEAVQPKKGVSTRGRGHGRGRGRGRGQRAAVDRSKVSSDESDGGVKKLTKPQVKRGGRGRGGAPRKPVGKKTQEHIVSIPTNMFNSKPLIGKKRKGLEGDSEKSLDASKRPTTEFVADAPTDLASLYAKKGGVDLSILSELTQSVSGDDGLPSRSKRTCVRVREQISKLQEILDDESDTKPSPGGAGSKVKGRGTGRVSTGGRTSDVGLQESSVATSAKKYKRPAYSQFTHKRRKRKKKSPEEEALWQPARQQPSGEKRTQMYVFSTTWANKAADTVQDGMYDNIIKFHKAQPKGPGYLTLDSKDKKSPSPQPKSESEESEEEVEDSKDDSEDKPPPPKRGAKGRAKVNTPTKAVTPRSGKKPVRKSPLIPKAFLRSSSRLRKQRNDPEEFDSPKEITPNHTPSPSPPPVTRRTRGSMGGRGTRASRNSIDKQKSPENYPLDSESESNIPLARKNESDDDKYKSDEETLSKKPKLEESNTVGTSPVGSSPGNPPSKIEPPPPNKDEINYTICHGTPREKKDEASQGVLAKPKGPLPAAPILTPSETAFSPEVTGATTLTLQSQHSQAVIAEQRPLNKATPTEQPRESSAWNPNLGHQFAGMHHGYPPVYNPALHGMAYHGHAPAIPGSNYPFPMGYPWSSAHQLQEQHRHSAHSADGVQYMRVAEASGSSAMAHATTNSSVLHQRQQQQHRAAQMQSSAARPTFSAEGHSNQLAKPQTTLNLSHPPLHTHTSPVSASSPLGHQAPHTFAQPASLNPDYHFGAPNPQSHSPHFSYGFEQGVSPLQQMQHLWQTQQMQSPHHISQIAGIRGPHLSTHMHAPGLWYPPTQPMAHFMQGAGEVPAAHYKKAAGKPAKPLPQDKAGANHNTNNNNSTESDTDERTFLNVGPYLAKYQAKAFPMATGSPSDVSLTQMIVSDNIESSDQQSSAGRSCGSYYSSNATDS